MFAERVGSVKMHAKVSDSVAADLVQRLDRRVRDAMPGFQGRFIKSTGDGLLLGFEEAPAAVRCAGEIHRLCDELARGGKQDFLVRIAAHTGEVLHGDGDIHGNTVNLAARILSVAVAGETSVTAETWAGLGAGERQGFVPHGPEMFKGFARFCFLHKKPNPDPLMDPTLRPGSLGDEETVRHLTDAMPKHARYALVLEHPQLNKTVLLSEGETHVFGRAPECGTVIADRMLSGTHAAFAVVEGILWCFDLESSNGVTYRGRRVRRRTPVEKNSMVELPAGSIQVKLP